MNTELSDQNTDLELGLAKQLGTVASLTGLIETQRALVKRTISVVQQLQLGEGDVEDLATLLDQLERELDSDEADLSRFQRFFTGFRREVETYAEALDADSSSDLPEGAAALRKEITDLRNELLSLRKLLRR